MTMNLDKLKAIISEEIIRKGKRPLQEGLSKKDFIMMAREIRKASPQYQEILTRFSIVLAKNQNPRFDEKRFRAAVETGKGI